MFILRINLRQFFPSSLLKVIGAPPHASTIDQTLRNVFSELEQENAGTARVPRSCKKDNTTITEKLALNSLRKLPNLIINKVDKGNNIVLQSREDYIWESYRQLSNPLHYEKLVEPLYPSTAIKINRIICK